MAIGRRTARSLARSLIACGVLIASLLPAPAAGALYMDDYRDFRTDPDDAAVLWHGPEHDPGWGGIRSTTRSVWTNEDGRRWLTIVIAPSGWAENYVRLDTDGDRAAEFVMWIEVGCAIHGQGRERMGHYRSAGGSPDDNEDGLIACHVPLAFVRPSARIAWRVRATTVQDDSAQSIFFDRAPNLGWYV